MAVVAVFQGPTLTQERYEQTVRKLSGGKSRMESPADWPVEGLLVHIAGQGGSGFRVVDLKREFIAIDSLEQDVVGLPVGPARWEGLRRPDTKSGARLVGRHVPMVERLCSHQFNHHAGLEIVGRNHGNSLAQSH